MEVEAFAAMEAEFLARVSRMVWCNVATIDRQGRPRSRILHPLWEGPVGWIGTRRESLKARHLAAQPFVSLAYIADVAKPVYVDCHAAWIDDAAANLGYDPAPIFERVDHPNFGLLQLEPWRIELANFPAPSQVWRPARA